MQHWNGECIGTNGKAGKDRLEPDYGDTVHIHVSMCTCMCF